MAAMDEATYARCLSHARRVCPADPAIDGEDVLHAAWLKCGALLPGLPTDLDRVRLLTRKINQVATDHHRRAQRHPAIPLVDWHPSGADVEAEALARVELGAVLMTVPPALLHFALGYLWAEIAAATGVPLATPRVQAHRWRQAQTEAQC